MCAAQKCCVCRPWCLCVFSSEESIFVAIGCRVEISPNTFDPLCMRYPLFCCVLCTGWQSVILKFHLFLSSRPCRDYSFFGVESVREAVRDTLIHNCRVKAQEVIFESCKRVCLGLLIICLFTCHYHSKSVLAEEISLHLIAHGINLKHPDDFFTVRVYQEINLIWADLNLMGSSSENRNKERVDPLRNVSAGDFFFPH